MAKETLTAKVDSTVIVEIKKRAKKQNRSKSYIANELLINAIKKTK